MSLTKTILEALRPLVLRHAQTPVMSVSRTAPFRIVNADLDDDNRQSGEWNPFNFANAANVRPLPLGSTSGDIGLRVSWPSTITAGSVALRVFGLIPIELDANTKGAHILTASTASTPQELDMDSPPTDTGLRYQAVELYDRANATADLSFNLASADAWRDDQNTGDQRFSNEVILDSAGCAYALVLCDGSAGGLTGTGVVIAEARPLSKS